MQVPTHLAISWLIGHGLSERRDRRLVAYAGILPDLDALTLLKGWDFYSVYHHVLTHGLLASIAITAFSTALARRRWKVLGLCLVTTHFHLVCDFLGSGRGWPIVYWYPFSHHEYYTPYGWPLASWQNLVIGLAAVIACGWIGVRQGRTFAETFLPAKADEAIVKSLRRWFSRGAL